MFVVGERVGWASEESGAEKFHPNFIHSRHFENLLQGPGAILCFARISVQVVQSLQCFSEALFCLSALLSSSRSDLLPSRPPAIPLRHVPPHPATHCAPRLAPLNLSHFWRPLA
jgi:hypothetical protein